MQGSALLDIVLIAVTGGLLFRLYIVLGRRTGNERTREDFRLSGPAATPRPSDKVVAITDRSALKPEAPQAVSGDPTAQALAHIRLLDRAFDSDRFLSGARAAYEMIVTAFASGDRKTLKPLLSDEVYSAFDEAISSREQKQHKVAFTFVGLRDIKIVHAGVKDRNAEITVSFAAQFISSTSDAEGKLVEGDAKAVRDVNDIWTFARDLRSRDPNWTLVGTTGELP
ncbi:MAG: Tim44 domain-containing protein [Alphaproteobacteria bacterium]|nr:Tim44 domain-containing protein [Alphaproteobacteria bacterium]